MAQYQKAWDKLRQEGVTDTFDVVFDVYGKGYPKGITIGEKLAGELSRGAVAVASLRPPIFSTTDDRGESVGFAAALGFAPDPDLPVDVRLKEVAGYIAGKYGVVTTLYEVHDPAELLPGEEFMESRLPGVRLVPARETQATPALPTAAEIA